MSGRRRKLLAPAILAAAFSALPGVASASAAIQPRVLSTVTTTMLANGARPVNCLAGQRTGPSIARSTYTARWDGALTAHLRGTGTADDWDLAAYAPDGRRLAGSAGFYANELVQVRLRRGDRVVLQACRRTGRTGRMPLATTFVVLPVGQPAPGPRMSLVKVTVAGRRDVGRLESLGLDVTHDTHGHHANVILYSPAQAGTLRRAGFRFVTLVADLAAQERRERAAERAYARALGARGSPLPSGRTDYRTYEDYQLDMKRLVERYPDRVRPFPLKGKTSEGRDLQAVEIAANVATPPEGRPYFFLNAMHHAREWPAAETPMEFAIDLATNYGRDARITNLLKRVRVIVMPLTNADGFNNSRSAPINPDPEEGAGPVWTLTGLAPTPGTGSYRRKNCNYPFPSVVPCELQLGVDPNRNYGYRWGGPGASSAPYSQTYRGPAPFSEPEVQAVRELVMGIQATSLLTIHNVAALVLRPPGLEEDGFAPDEQRLKLLGDKMARATGYTSQYGWQLYDTTGTTDDWSYPATGGFGYTIEIGPPGGDFHLRYEKGVIQEYLGEGKIKGVREAYLLAAENAREPVDTSRIAGRAPKGRTLRIVKRFQTETYEVCALSDPLPVDLTGSFYCVGPGEVMKLDEKHESTITVPASGRFEWWVNPSTRPFVKKAGGRETWKLTCEDGGRVIETHEVVVERGQTFKKDMPCGGKLVKAKRKAKPKRKACPRGKSKAKRKSSCPRKKSSPRTKR